MKRAVEVLYLLVPLSLALAGLVVWALLWAVRSGQFEDLEGAAHRILQDEDDGLHGGPREASGDETERDSRGKPSPGDEDSREADDPRLERSDQGTTGSQTS